MMADADSGPVAQSVDAHACRFSFAQPDLYQKLFEKAVQEGNGGLIERILEDKQEKVNVNCMDTDGQRPLHQGCLHGNLDMVKLLIRFGADVGLTNRDGWSPLHLAAYTGHRDVLLYLIRNYELASSPHTRR